MLLNSGTGFPDSQGLGTQQAETRMSEGCPMLYRPAGAATVTGSGAEHLTPVLCWLLHKSQAEVLDFTDE